ncbi:FbpB family small basic protein [Cytobacillus firmus]|nr:FbpB family small basic protein [Cytobacillus firmus]
MRPKKRRFADLVLENKRQLIKDKEIMEKIEEKLENKVMYRKKLKS